jgi:hypothetical protein
MSANRGTIKDNAQQQTQQSIEANRNRPNCIKCRITEFWKPGDETPFEDDPAETNSYRVAVMPEDLSGQAYAYALKNRSFTVNADPDVVMLNYGSHNLLDKSVLIKWHSLGPEASGEAFLESRAAYGKAAYDDASDVEKAKALDLGEVLNFSLG